jgi:hypothetical protein
MGGKRILNDEQIQEMCALREKGWGIQRIADHFTANGTAISFGAISWQCLRAGADTLPQFYGATRQAGTAYRRNGRVVRPFTPDEDDLIRKLDMQGVDLTTVAQRLNRQRQSVLARLATLARREARQEALGQRAA